MNRCGVTTFRPRSSRHTTATHLLRAGVDINTVRAWLGHVSLDTTNIYAEIDLEMKAKALAKCEVTACQHAQTALAGGSGPHPPLPLQTHGQAPGGLRRSRLPSRPVTDHALSK